MASNGGPVIEGSHLAKLYTQLKNLDTMGTNVKEQMRQVVNWRFRRTEDADLCKFFREQEDTLRSFQGLLDDQRSSVRNDINILSRPHLRPLQILDMPDEILVKICEYVGNLPSTYGLLADDDDEDSYSDAAITAAVNIQKLRLTCQRLCNTSSHLLLDRVQVDVNTKSLSRFEEISLHPTISKGVRTVRIGLDFYDSVLAGDIWTFANHYADVLPEAIDKWEGDYNLNPMCYLNEEYWDDMFPEELASESIETSRVVMESWRNFGRRQIQDGEKDFKYRSALQRGHAEYCRRFADQERLRENGLFIQSVAAAIARMPRAKNLEVLDEYDRRDSSLRTDTDDMLEDVMLEALVRETLLPLRWEQASRSNLGQPPAELLVKLPGAIFKAGVSLDSLDIRLSSPKNLSIVAPGEEHQHLTSSVQKLRKFFFRMTGQPDSRPVVSTRELEDLRTLLDALLNTESIEVIELDLGILTSQLDGDHDRPPPFGIGSLINSRNWHELFGLRLESIPVQFSELQSFVKRRYGTKMHVLEGLCVFRGMHLLDGTWAAALDLFRKKASYIELYGSWGAECASLTSEKYYSIFGETWSTRDHKANQYIREEIRKNPLNGLLAVDPTSSDESSDGEMSNEDMSDGEMSNEDMSDGEMSDEDISDGEMSNEDMSDEEDNDDHLHHFV